MKVTQAILLLALIGSAGAHATLSTGELPQGTMNCPAALDRDTAEKKAETNVVVNRVYADNSQRSTPRPQSTGKGTASH